MIPRHHTERVASPPAYTAHSASTTIHCPTAAHGVDNRCKPGDRLASSYATPVWRCRVVFSILSKLHVHARETLALASQQAVSRALLSAHWGGTKVWASGWFIGVLQVEE
jgi:hypothetical protein